LDVLLEEFGRSAVSLHSYKSQPQRLLALSRFKSGQVPVLISTDVGSRGLDIPTVDLVINYDIPRLDIPTVNHHCQCICECWHLTCFVYAICRFPCDYIHRVGRTARASRGGLSISFVTQVC
jgi:ATP-dependent RNA helicase DDX49/DBP8